MMRVLDEDSLRFFSSIQGMSLFGHAVALFAGHPSYIHVEFGTVTSYLAAAVRHQQLKCYFCESSGLTGVAIWMWLDEAVLARIYQSGSYPPELHISEWREGDIFFIADVIAHRGRLRKIIRDIRTSVPATASKVAWINPRRRRLRFTSLHKKSSRALCDR